MAAMQGANQEQFNVQHLAQGHLSMEPGIRTSDLLITRRPALPPELHVQGSYIDLVTLQARNYYTFILIHITVAHKD